MTDAVDTSTKFNPNDYLMKLKGKDYLEVKWRLVWLRQEHPDAVITTQHILIEDNRAVFKSTITIPGGGSATGYGSETVKDFGDFIEKAETKANGRALAALGYGTQHAPELEEGERIVDAPGSQRDSRQGQAQPTQMQQAPKKASDKQINFIKGMWKEMGYVTDDGHHDATALDGWLQGFWNLGIDELNGQQATEVIDLLKSSQPAQEVGTAELTY